MGFDSAGASSRRVVSVQDKAMAVVAAILVIRLPGAFILLLVVPWAIVLLRWVRPRAVLGGPMRWLLGWAFLSSLVSSVFFHPAALSGTSSAFVIICAVIGSGCVISGSPHPAGTARSVLKGLYAGAVLVWALAMGEVASGIKLLPLLYPGANTAGTVSSDRLVVTATYPNYNDFGVVMVMLYTGVLARMIFRPARGARSFLRWCIVFTTVILVGYAGSRGAALGFVVSTVLLVILNIRRLHRAALGVRFAVLGGGIGLALAAGLWTSPYVQDHSTAKRGVILANALSMMASNPTDGLFGYGSLPEYQAAAQATYGAILMDPHNLLLELCLWCGVPALVLFVVAWAWILGAGYLPRRPVPDWTTAYGLVTVLLLPVLGVVPSSTLRYHVTWLYLLATAALVVSARQMAVSRQGPSVTSSLVSRRAP